MEKLKLYTVDDDYIEYLKHFDKQVMFSKGDDYLTDRKYLGVVLEINGFKYFAPLSSPKDSYYFYKIRKCKEQILKNAKILYNQKTKNYAGINYLKSTVDFTKIENCCKKYIKY